MISDFLPIIPEKMQQITNHRQERNGANHQQTRNNQPVSGPHVHQFEQFNPN